MTGATELPQPGDIIADRYSIERIVGIGQASVVYSARRREGGSPVALKWLLPEAETLGRTALGPDGSPLSNQESKVIGHFRHPNVLATHAIGEVGGSYYFVMDWLEGESLATRLRRVRSLPLSEVRRLLIPCMRGMHEAHRVGIVHGDLKPANILLCRTSEGEPEIAKILDFELDSDCRSVEDVLPLLERGQLAALDYQAPEQRTTGACDHRADIYAFGAIIHRMLTGEVLLEDAAEREATPASRGTPPPLPSKKVLRTEPGATVPRTVPFRFAAAPDPTDALVLPEGSGDGDLQPHRAVAVQRDVDPILRRALANDPADRFASLQELADALEACALTAANGGAPCKTGFLGDAMAFAATLPATPRGSASGPQTGPRVFPAPPLSPDAYEPPLPAAGERAPARINWLYVAMTGAALLASGALLVDRGPSDDDVIASFEAVADGSAIPLPPAATAAPLSAASDAPAVITVPAVSAAPAEIRAPAVLGAPRAIEPAAAVDPALLPRGVDPATVPLDDELDELDEVDEVIRLPVKPPPIVRRWKSLPATAAPRRDDTEPARGTVASPAVRRDRRTQAGAIRGAAGREATDIPMDLL